MKRNQLLVLAVLTLGFQGTAMSSMTDSVYPSDAEASHDLPALETYAEAQTRMGNGPEAWGVSPREQPADPFLEAFGIGAHGPFPSRGGPIDD